MTETSNASIAARFGCSSETVRRWRTGERFPDAADQARIFDLTEGLVTPNDWVGVGHRPEAAAVAAEHCIEGASS